jgi:hypothetical protein
LNAVWQTSWCSWSPDTAVSSLDSLQDWQQTVNNHIKPQMIDNFNPHTSVRGSTTYLNLTSSIPHRRNGPWYWHSKEYHPQMAASVKAWVLLEIQNKIHVYHKIMNSLNFNNWGRGIKGFEIMALHHDQERRLQGADMKTICWGVLCNQHTKFKLVLFQFLSNKPHSDIPNLVYIFFWSQPKYNITHYFLIFNEFQFSK